MAVELLRRCVNVMQHCWDNPDPRPHCGLGVMGTTLRSREYGIPKACKCGITNTQMYQSTRNEIETLLINAQNENFTDHLKIHTKSVMSS